MGIQVHEDRYGCVSVTLTPAGTAAGPVTQAQTFTVSGLKTGDEILKVTPPSTTAGLGIVGAWVSAADTLEVLFGNFSSGALTSASGTYRVHVFRPENDRTSVDAAVG